MRDLSNPPPQRKSIVLTIEVEPGRVVVRSDAPGLYLAGSSYSAVMADIGPALSEILRRNQNWPKI